MTIKIYKCPECNKEIRVTNEEVCYNASVHCENGHYYQALKFTIENKPIRVAILAT